MVHPGRPALPVPTATTGPRAISVLQVQRVLPDLLVRWVRQVLLVPLAPLALLALLAWLARMAQSAP